MYICQNIHSIVNLTDEPKIVHTCLLHGSRTSYMPNEQIFSHSKDATHCVVKKNSEDYKTEIDQRK